MAAEYERLAQVPFTDQFNFNLLRIRKAKMGAGKLLVSDRHVGFYRGTYYGNPLSFAKVYCKATTPPTTGSSAFGESSNRYSYLGVPVGCKAAYQAKSDWKNSFTTIEEIEF